MKEFARTERIGAELRRDLAAILRDEVKDPRCRNLTLQEVRVSRDLAHAKVYFTDFSPEADGAAQARLLNGRLAGFLRGQLARRLRLRTVPQLHFVQDQSIAHGERLSRLIEEAATALPPREEAP